MRFSIIRLVQRLFLGMGLVLLAWTGGTVAYAEFYQRYQSSQFDDKIASHERPSAEVPVERPADLKEGDVVGRLAIPRVGISVIVLQGVEDDLLRIGAGHVPGTPLPGGNGNSAIAAHRDTFFRKLEGVREGDRLQFTSLRGTFDYVVGSTEIVEPQDTRAIESRGIDELTLISCYPFYFVGSAPHRFIVHATPITSVLLGTR
jgi:sortase A